MKKEESTKFLKLCLAEALIRMMQEQSYESINISAVCERAGVGRTTYYRHFDTKGGKEELLVFKLVSEWQAFACWCSSWSPSGRRLQKSTERRRSRTGQRPFWALCTRTGNCCG